MASPTKTGEPMKVTFVPLIGSGYGVCFLSLVDICDPRTRQHCALQEMRPVAAADVALSVCLSF